MIAVLDLWAYIFLILYVITNSVMLIYIALRDKEQWYIFLLYAIFPLGVVLFCLIKSIIDKRKKKREMKSEEGK